jgi:hypothetical protein
MLRLMTRARVTKKGEKSAAFLDVRVVGYTGLDDDQLERVRSVRETLLMATAACSARDASWKADISVCVCVCVSFYVSHGHRYICSVP